MRFLQEYAMAMSSLFRGKPEEKLEWAFHIYDNQNLGFVTLDDMIAVSRR